AVVPLVVGLNVVGAALGAAGLTVAVRRALLWREVDAVDRPDVPAGMADEVVVAQHGSPAHDGAFSTCSLRPAGGRVSLATVCFLRHASTMSAKSWSMPSA